MSQEPYTPPADQAECPFCGATVPAVDANAALWMVALFFRCPGCGHSWNENRQHGQPATRIWTPADADKQPA